MEAATNTEKTMYNGITIPAGFSPTKIAGEYTIDDGLVITDSRGNEYVWIEVPNDGSGPDYSNVESNNTINTTKIYNSLVNYCKTDKNGNDLLTSALNDVWYDSAGKKKNNSTNLNDNSVCGLTSIQYTELYNKMLTSIYKNGGFWIGRYEAGITSPRKSKNDSIEGLYPYSKQDMYPINYVSCSQAQTLASKVINTGDYKSSIMFGIQWNLVIKFLNNKGVETEKLNGDSGSWGNYCNKSFVIDRGKYSVQIPWNEFYDYKTIIENEVKVENNKIIKLGTNDEYNAVLLTTGASENNKKKNIYDLSGNLSEFTLMMQKFSNTKTCNSFRGGYAWSRSDTFNVALNIWTDFDTIAEFLRGFRVAIY